MPDDEVPIPLRKCSYVDGDNNHPIPDDDGDGVTGEIVKPKRRMGNVVADHGIFLIDQDASPDGEDCDAWLRRWDDQKPWWPAVATEEWDAMKGPHSPQQFSRKQTRPGTSVKTVLFK